MNDDPRGLFGNKYDWRIMHCIMYYYIWSWYYRNTFDGSMDRLALYEYLLFFSIQLQFPLQYTVTYMCIMQRVYQREQIKGMRADFGFGRSLQVILSINLRQLY